MDMIKGSLPGMKIFAANRTNIIRNIYIGTIWDSMNLNERKGYFWHAEKNIPVTAPETQMVTFVALCSVTFYYRKAYIVLWTTPFEIPGGIC